LWAASQYPLQKLGKVFGIVQIATRWYESIPELKSKCYNSYVLIEELFKVYAIDKVLQYRAEMLAEGYYNSATMAEIENEYGRLCVEIGESSANVIDAIANQDFMHGSPIGSETALLQVR
jgi:Acyl-CoA oxidase